MEKKYISSAELASLIKTNQFTIKVVVLDVRSLVEFEEGHIWSALHRPIDSLPNSARDLPKETRIITVCNKGYGRSEAAMNILRETGWKNTYWLEGGYLGWVEAGFPDYESGFTNS